MLSLKLSNQAVGSLMLAMQRGMLAASKGLSKEECDIVSLLKGFEFENSVDGLIVINPPTVDFLDEFDEDDDKTY